MPPSVYRLLNCIQKFFPLITFPLFTRVLRFLFCRVETWAGRMNRDMTKIVRDASGLDKIATVSFVHVQAVLVEILNYTTVTFMVH